MRIISSHDLWRQRETFPKIFSPGYGYNRNGPSGAPIDSTDGDTAATADGQPVRRDDEDDSFQGPPETTGRDIFDAEDEYYGFAPPLAAGYDGQGFIFAPSATSPGHGILGSIPPPQAAGYNGPLNDPVPKAAGHGQSVGNGNPNKKVIAWGKVAESYAIRNAKRWMKLNQQSVAANKKLLAAEERLAEANRQLQDARARLDRVGAPAPWLEAVKRNLAATSRPNNAVAPIPVSQELAASSGLSMPVARAPHESDAKSSSPRRQRKVARRPAAACARGDVEEAVSRSAAAADPVEQVNKEIEEIVAVREPDAPSAHDDSESDDFLDGMFLSARGTPLSDEDEERHVPPPPLAAAKSKKSVPPKAPREETAQKAAAQKAAKKKQTKLDEDAALAKAEQIAQRDKNKFEKMRSEAEALVNERKAQRDEALRKKRHEKNEAAGTYFAKQYADRLKRVEDAEKNPVELEVTVRPGEDPREVIRKSIEAARAKLKAKPRGERGAPRPGQNDATPSAAGDAPLPILRWNGNLDATVEEMTAVFVAAREARDEAEEEHRMAQQEAAAADAAAKAELSLAHEQSTSEDEDSEEASVSGAKEESAEGNAVAPAAPVEPVANPTPPGPSRFLRRFLNALRRL
ncbi:MAG: hypothetical protein V4534_07935 [Myxococcota bacterium]